MQNTYLTQVVIFATLAAYVALDARGQGKFTDLTRECVSMSKQAAVNRILHVLYPAKYALVAVAFIYLSHFWGWLVVAPLLRFALFDVVLTVSRGDKLFSLGTSSAVDRLVGRVPFLNPFLRVAALLACAALLVWLPQ